MKVFVISVDMNLQQDKGQGSHLCTTSARSVSEDVDYIMS